MERARLMPGRRNRFIRRALNHLEDKAVSGGCKQAGKLFCGGATPGSRGRIPTQSPVLLGSPGPTRSSRGEGENLWWLNRNASVWGAETILGLKMRAGRVNWQQHDCCAAHVRCYGRRQGDLDRLSKPRRHCCAL